ncbi:hypothetical protein F8388_012866 [Cannabis sativa]|uniref:Uncharacterized protein n=1 Tax=Cannabis sativa TaxID=3483 RepID=A0A7J6ESX7_CANSA|nr:hypothetical protein F8388_012866 [Cannabis sativa]
MTRRKGYEKGDFRVTSRAREIENDMMIQIRLSNATITTLGIETTRHMFITTSINNSKYLHWCPSIRKRVLGGLSFLPNALSITFANDDELKFNSGLGNPLTHQWVVGPLWLILERLCPNHNPMLHTRRIQLQKTQDLKEIPRDQHQILGQRSHNYSLLEILGGGGGGLA